MNDDLLEVLQADIAAILRATPRLADVNIIADNAGDLEGQILSALKTLSATNFKNGLACLVMLPEISDAEENLPGPEMRVACEIQVVEQVLMNRAASGTGIRSSQAALAVLKALHLQHLGGCLLYGAKDPVKPLPVKKGYVSHVVRVMARSVGNMGPDKPAAVDAVWDAGVVLSCATGGAQIHYTTDGSYPAPGTNLYTQPITALPAGTVVRAAAYAENLNPGDATELTITD